MRTDVDGTIGKRDAEEDLSDTFDRCALRHLVCCVMSLVPRISAHICRSGDDRLFLYVDFVVQGEDGGGSFAKI